MGVILRSAENESVESITGIHYYLNKCYLPSKYVTDDNFVFQQDSTLKCNTTQLWQCELWLPFSSAV